ncbi:ribonuclease Z [archaeon]|jgi:ribonuclease Z|nr:ribonuclease Z [archaeon]MBT4023108.1 ribonuclease Z [archaeon]MBT4272506.1 ribonuclease Z [archaeon]MBT4460604.1 ribonuclease Z [archaeon]MBT4857806.1 ribonuclease Z [archaeon]
MDIVFLGTSCMVPTKERNHSGIFLSYRGEGILVDCGEGIQRQLKIAEIKPTKITKIFLTHWHGDHVLGLPGLLQTLNSSEYEKKLEIYGPIGTKKSFEYMFKAFSFKIDFEYKIKELSNNNFSLKEIVVSSLLLEHKIPCLGFSFTEKDRRRIKPAIIKKLGIPDGPLLGELQNNKKITWKGKEILPKETTYLVKGKKISIILDTVLTKNVYSLAKDSNLLICESSYDSSLEEKAKEYKHLTAKQAALLASQTNVKKLVLTHISQRYKTPKILLEDAKDVFEDVCVAYDFMKLKI